MIKDPIIDNEIIYCYSQLQKFSDIELFIKGPTSANIPKIAEKLYENK